MWVTETSDVHHSSQHIQIISIYIKIWIYAFPWKMGAPGNSWLCSCIRIANLLGLRRGSLCPPGPLHCSHLLSGFRKHLSFHPQLNSILYISLFLPPAQKCYGTRVQHFSLCSHKLLRTNAWPFSIISSFAHV